MGNLVWLLAFFANVAIQPEYPAAGSAPVSIVTMSFMDKKESREYNSMNRSESWHPGPKDLVNLAKERLSVKKTQDILDHCKGCQECTDILLATVRSQSITGERRVLSKWNWISTATLALSLIALVVTTFWLLGNTSRSGWFSLEGEIPVDFYETIYTEAPTTWFEDAFTHAMVSPDGSQMLRVDSLGVSLIDLSSGEDMRAELLLDFDQVMAATFDGNGRIARFANRRRDMGWFLESGEKLRLTAIPLDAVPAWAPGNRDVIWIRPPGTQIVLGEPPDDRWHNIGDQVLGLAWAPTGAAAYALAMSVDGSASVLRARPVGGEVEIVRGGLDASALPNGLAVAPDGQSLFIALATAQEPDADARHSPRVNRDLDIYELELASGDLHLVSGIEGDDFWPWVAGDYLYWTHNDYDASVMLIPLGNPDAEPLFDVAGKRDGAFATQLPRWNPTGDMLAYTVGSWRLADWGLNLDTGVVAIAPDGTSGRAGVLVSGYHADYTPSWSPNGRWLAYRSRRSPRPVPYYAGPDVADDIFLRRADDPAADEIRLTDFGWEVGGPSWSADSSRLLFDSWDRVPGVSKPWVATIDPERGDLIEVVPLKLPEEVSGSVSAIYSPVSDDVLLIERLNPETQALWIMSASGEVEKVIEFTSYTRGGAAWTPDGERIVYSALAAENMQLFSVSRFGDEPQQLTAETANVLHAQVSPDGLWIAATRLFQRKEIRRLSLH